ncbi:MAG: response regulator transcription factor [Haliscomenobacter sp.]|nr:response regulator transcription factor [Haliscomenobacter sp.]
MMEKNSIRVSIVDDELEITELLKDLISGEPDMEITSSFSNAEDAIQGIQANPPDVVIMDIGLPGESGIACVVRLKQVLPNVAFLMYTIWENERVFEALEAGADGYILKKEETSLVLHAIRDVHQGLSAASPYIARKIFDSFRTKKKADETLTPTEKEVLEILAKGKMYKELSSELGLSEPRIKRIIHGIYSKLQVNSRMEAVNKYLGRL